MFEQQITLEDRDNIVLQRRWQICFPRDLGTRVNPCKRDAKAACYAMSNNLLCLQLRSLVSPAGIYETVAG